MLKNQSLQQKNCIPESHNLSTVKALLISVSVSEFFIMGNWPCVLSPVKKSKGFFASSLLTKCCRPVPLTVGASQKLLKKITTKYDHIFGTYRHSELAASEFFSNFVWTPESAPIILLKIWILSWNSFWILILWQKLALGVNESIFCQKISQNGQKIKIKMLRVPCKKS